MNWFLSRAIGGVRVLVPEEELAVAKEILGNPSTEGHETRPENIPAIPLWRLITAILVTMATPGLFALGILALLWRRYRKIF